MKAINPGAAAVSCALLGMCWLGVHACGPSAGSDTDGGFGGSNSSAGDRNHPRILGAFNEKTPDWLAFFMFTYFTDRDGKFQLCALAESAFDPLARTTRFMLTEEAHHMFVGEAGVSRVIRRTCDIMAKHKTDNPERLRELGVVD